MMLSNVTLEQLNAPTDLEKSLRRSACDDDAFVWMQWDKDGSSDIEYGRMNSSWIKQRALELKGSREASVETHEDEELMIRVKLDEGV